MRVALADLKIIVFLVNNHQLTLNFIILHLLVWIQTIVQNYCIMRIRYVKIIQNFLIQSLKHQHDAIIVFYFFEFINFKIFSCLISILIKNISAFLRITAILNKKKIINYNLGQVFVWKHALIQCLLWLRNIVMFVLLLALIFMFLLMHLLAWNLMMLLLLKVIKLNYPFQ